MWQSRRMVRPLVSTGLGVRRSRHRLDCMVTRQTDEDYGKVRVDYRMPLGLSGFRDHRPLVERVCTRARWKQQQPEEEKPRRWDRSLVEREYRRKPEKGKKLPVRRSQCFFNFGERSIEWYTAITPDIEAEVVKRALDTCCTVQQRKA